MTLKTYDDTTHVAVPREPTKEMVVAGNIGQGFSVHALRAAIAAAPEHEPSAYTDVISDGGLDPRNKPELNPADLSIEIVYTRLGGGFAPISTNGIKLTHKPTGISVTKTEARSQHRNRFDAMEELKVLVAESPEHETVQQEPVANCISVDRGRVWLKVGSQSFMFAYEPEDEPEASAADCAQWYADQVRKALSKITSPQPDLAAKVAELEALIQHLRDVKTMDDHTTQGLEATSAKQAKQIKGIRSILVSVLCDPEGKCCIQGGDGDRVLIDGAIAELDKLSRA